MSARVRWYASAASGEPHFAECLFDMLTRAPRPDENWATWKAAADERMRDGRHLWYLGGYEPEPDEPHAYMGRPNPQAPD